MKLRTKFLLASLAISLGLTLACLLLVRSVIGAQARNSVSSDLKDSILTFKNVQQQREASRVRSARLIADLPIVRALMTTEDRRTIQDASGEIAHLAEADLLVLTNRDGELMALQANQSSFGNESAAEQLRLSVRANNRTNWWFGGGRLYEVSVQPIFFGSAKDDRVLGYVALGYEVDDRLVRQLSQVADSEIAFFFGDTVVRSTLTDRQRADFVRQATPPPVGSQILLDNDHFLVDTLVLNSVQGGPVRFTVLKSLKAATAALHNLSRMLMITGIIALTFGAILVFIISDTFTRPLQKLVEGVRALGRGNYSYPLETSGDDEVAEVTAAFNRMRTNLEITQRELLESEKLATIGRMASSISHDLRHHLVAILANAEFLLDQRRDLDEREDLYGEVRAGVREMNDLIESLLEFSRTRASLALASCRIGAVIDRAVQTARMHPNYREIPVVVRVTGECEGCFDSKRLERVFSNLLINAFAAVAPTGASVSVTAGRINGSIEVRVADQGPGIPDEVSARIFEPFFSFGKENGTGLGLSVAQKLVQDHGGELRLESTSSKGSVFLLILPISSSKNTGPVYQD